MLTEPHKSYMPQLSPSAQLLHHCTMTATWTFASVLSSHSSSCRYLHAFRFREVVGTLRGKLLDRTLPFPLLELRMLVGGMVADKSLECAKVSGFVI